MVDSEFIELPDTTRLQQTISGPHYLLKKFGSGVCQVASVAVQTVDLRCEEEEALETKANAILRSCFLKQRGQCGQFQVY